MKRTKGTLIGILAGIILSLPVYATDYVPGELIVKFRSPLGASSAVKGEADEKPVVIAVDDTATALSELQSRDDVEYAEPNYIIEAESIPNDWAYNLDLWADARLPQAWDLLSASGPGQVVVIAVIDSGVDTDHPDLAGILIPGYDYANNDADPEDDSGHGTRVCGIISALGDNGTGIAGVAWNIDTQIMPLKFMKLSSGKTTGSVSDAIEAIYDAVDQGADIINASWGFSNYSAALESAIRYARDHGVLFVCSAGNNAKDNDTNDHYPSNYTLDNIIAVAALNSYGELASFSNYGRVSVDVAAPGVGLSSTDLNGGYVSFISGTSFATPFVAAVAAMVKSQNPAFSYKALRSTVINSAIATKAPSIETIASGGCVDAYQALVAEGIEDTSGDTSAGGGQNGSDQRASSEGGGGGGGCLIDASKNPGSALMILAFLTLAVLFRMPHTRRSE
jgi:subtilisin family serine protease